MSIPLTSPEVPQVGIQSFLYGTLRDIQDSSYSGISVLFANDAWESLVSQNETCNNTDTKLDCNAREMAQQLRAEAAL